MTKRNPYDVLGVKAAMGKDELKSHYRRLVVENHPDKLMARGVPKEFVAIATEKLAAINEAYAQIANERVNLVEQFDAAWRRRTVLIDFHSALYARAGSSWVVHPSRPGLRTGGRIHGIRRRASPPWRAR